LGIGDWGLGGGGLGPSPKPPTPKPHPPNPQSPIPNPHILFQIIKKMKVLKFKIINKNLKEEIKNNKVNILTQGENKIKYKPVKIPKLLLNKKLLEFYDIKRVNYSNRKKITASSKDYSFLKNPNSKELRDYFYTKNRIAINDISLKSIKKRNSTLISENNYKNINKIRKKIFKAIKLEKNENKKNKSTNISIVGFNKEKSNLEDKIKEYMKKRKNERNNLSLLINNPFNYYNKENKGKSKLFPKLNRKLILEKINKQKKINSEVSDLIKKEYNNAKSLLNNKFMKEDEIFEKNLLRKKIFRKKMAKNINTNIFLYKPGEIQKNLINKRVNLIKKNLNNSDLNMRNFDYKNNFRTNLYLSVSQSVDQLFNTRLFGKLINDNSFIKDLMEEVNNKHYKKYLEDDEFI
jgi:hypothetical protein